MKKLANEIIIAFLVVFSFTGLTKADILYVPSEYSTIQAAIDAANDGDTIWVADGTYRGQGNRDIDFKGKAITVTSENGPDNCIIDCETLGRGFYFHNGEEQSSILAGFTITNGYIPYDVGAGGGIRCIGSNPTIDNCIIRGNSAGTGGGMDNWFGSPTLTNCTFSSNSAEDGGGMDNWFGSPMLTNCTFSGNRAEGGGGEGGGLDNWEGSPTLIDCTFIGNFAVDNGGGMYSGGGSPTLTNCTFSGNSAGEDGGGIYCQSSSPTITNCIFSGNRAEGEYSYGGGLDGCDGPIINCTIVGNRARGEGGGLTDCTGPVTNCIIWNNFAPRDPQVPYYYGPYYGYYGRLTYSCIEGWTDDSDETDNISDDPLFLVPGYWADANNPSIPVEPDDPTAVWVDGAYRLREDSPCIDAGDNTAVSKDATDIDNDGDTTEPIPWDPDGNPRFFDDPNIPDTGNGIPPIVDMGAYEKGAKHGFLISTTSVTVPEGETATFMVALVRDPLGPVQVSVAHLWGDLDITIESGALLTFDSSNYWDSQTVTLAAAEDGDNLDGIAVVSVSSTGFGTTWIKATERENEPNPNVVFVDANASGANKGWSWADALTDLQDALSVATAQPVVEEIRVAQGIYTPAAPSGDREATFRLINGVAIKGSYAGCGQPNPDARNVGVYETILTGDLNGDDGPDFANNDENSYHVVTGNGVDATVVLDGFTITGGCSAGMYNDQSSPTLTSCTFSGNEGSGMYNFYSSPTINNCTFSGNSAYKGGGMHNQGSYPTLTNCTFSDNTADFRGGGIYNNYSDPTLSNCTFSGNSAGYGGGIHNFEGSNPRLTNCTFSGNSASSNGGGMHNGRGRYIQRNQPVLLNCTFSGNSANGRYSFGGGMYNNSTGSPVLTNCTFSGNSARYGGGGMYNSSNSGSTLTNCILWGNRDSGGEAETAQIKGGTPGVNYCCIQGWTGDLGGAGNIGSDPIFIDPGHWDPNGTSADANDDFWIEGDYRLWAGSPCIDAADGDVAPATDILGNGRYDDPNTANTGTGSPDYVDIGAYEFSPALPDSWEPDDTGPQANWLGAQQTHSIVPAGDVDWVRFIVTTESEVIIETSGAAGNTRISLYDSSLNEIEYNDDGGTGSFSRIDRFCGLDPLPAGTYYVAIDEYGNDDDIAKYDIILTVTACIPRGIDERLPIFRFWSPINSRHFYTIGEPERNKLFDKYSHVWTFEGAVYYVFAADAKPGLLPVYRFWSPVLVAHFYTIDPNERDKLRDEYPHIWTDEGIAFYAYPEGQQPGDAEEVYRFWSPVLETHFYTISETERDKLINKYSHVWTYEHIAWYAYE